MKLGRERIKAWIYSVINPLLDGLDIEASFLAKRNWTFRRYNGDLEFIRPTLAIVGYRNRPNWEDFTASNPKTKEKIESRNSQREELRRACATALDNLIKDLLFEDEVKQILGTVEAESPGETNRLFGNVSPYEAIGELLMNNLEELPQHYGLHKFWSRFGKELLPLRAAAAIPADQAGLRLRTSNDDLSEALSKLRGDLASEYDVPWSPYRDGAAVLTR